MANDYNALRYADETDRCFGLAGMAISLVVWDAEDLLRGIDLDAPAEEALQLSPEFHYCLSPKTGAKAAWEASFRHFQLIAAMTVANITCRHLVRLHHSSIDHRIDAAIRGFLNEEGAELCQLEPDEVSRIYGQILTHCSRIFRHPGVSSLASSLSDIIAREKVIGSDVLLEHLRPLNRM
ncbi:MAG: hypothetical protein K2F96_04010 [Muribaculaceae bacterium]|nr:hypothetical protein [Muribaculaceae bacterium]